MKMIVRDSYATINGDQTTHQFSSGGIEILASDGRSLFSVRLLDDGSIDVSGGDVCKHKGTLLDDRLLISPKASNRVTLTKPAYPKRRDGVGKHEDADYITL